MAVLCLVMAIVVTIFLSEGDVQIIKLELDTLLSVYYSDNT